MQIPGFSAERSLYGSNIHYCTAGSAARVETQISPTFFENRLEIANPGAWLGFREECEDVRVGGNVINPWKIFAPHAGQVVVPASVPAHPSDPSASSQCTDCKNNCAVTEAGCIIGVDLACAPLLAVPFVGGILYGGCVAIGAAACFTSAKTCVSNCFNIGSPCCPVACGSSCCGSSETCSDTGQGLCCSAGTQPCGADCCEGDEVCLEGVCCPLGGSVCQDGTCCDNICGQCQGGRCVATQEDGTVCLKGICCGGVCVDPNNNDQHCGNCNNVCATDRLCAGGRCICRQGQDCNGVCTDTVSDPAHCGSCTNVCPDGACCIEGHCRADCCPTGKFRCPCSEMCLPDTPAGHAACRHQCTL
jgi:hypothetical protein